MFLEDDITSEFSHLIAADEVGRGPLAGPVVACAVLFNGKEGDFSKDLSLLKSLKVTDSKKISAKKRRDILRSLIGDKQLEVGRVKKISETLSYSINEASPECIDEINILNASLKSMGEAVNTFKVATSFWVWIDGNKSPKNIFGNCSIQTFIKGDSRSLLIGLASIIAKEYRDSLMNSYSLKYPMYGFDKNSGYPTAFHKEALSKFGPCPIHRKTFRGVK